MRSWQLACENLPENGSVPLQTSKWPTVRKVGAVRNAVAAGDPSAVLLAEAQTAPAQGSTAGIEHRALTQELRAHAVRA